MRNIVSHLVYGVSMQNAHRGLAEIAKKNLKLDVENLNTGEFVLFINSAYTAFKLFAANNMVCYYRDPDGHMLTSDVLRLVPAFFTGSGVALDEAVARALRANYSDKIMVAERREKKRTIAERLAEVKRGRRRVKAA